MFQPVKLLLFSALVLGICWCIPSAVVSQSSLKKKRLKDLWCPALELISLWLCTVDRGAEAVLPGLGVQRGVHSLPQRILLGLCRTPGGRHVRFLAHDLHVHGCVCTVLISIITE